jgi:hypothetical protein
MSPYSAAARPADASWADRVIVSGLADTQQLETTTMSRVPWNFGGGPVIISLR